MAKQKIRLEFVDEGFKEILKSQGVADCIIKETVAIKQRAGDLYESEIVWGYGGTRWVGFVHNINQLGVEDEAENKTLSKAVK